jgi:hypothetical protein
MRLALVLCVLWAASLRAQAPDEAWRSISTAHLRVHYPRGLDSLARRAAGEGELAWTLLAESLVPPRGTIDLVLTDHQDISNGSASVFPTNRITVLARPPVDDAALRAGEDWLRFVITHEMAHLFHLDRSRGLWRVAQGVFGRHPALFPHNQAPRWLIEGVAMHYERLAGAGRLDGSQLHATLGALDAAGAPLTPRTASIATPRYPGGNSAYFAGARLVDAGITAGGDSSMRRFIEHGAGRLLPFGWDRTAQHAFGASFGALSATVSSTEPLPVPPAVQRLGSAWWDARAPRWRGDTIRFVATAPREIPWVFDVVDGDVRAVTRRNSVDAHGQAGDHAVYADLDLTDPYRYRSQLLRGERRLATPALERAASPDVRADGSIVAMRIVPGSSELIVVRDDTVLVLAAGTPDVQWSAPRWSRRGDRVAAIRWRHGGQTDVVVLDLHGGAQVFGTTRAVQLHPSWGPEDRSVYFASDRDGAMAVYRVTLATGVIERVLEGASGIFEPEVSPDGQRLAAFLHDADGYHLFVAAIPAVGRVPGASRPALAGIATPEVGGASRAYSPWRSLIPRYWIPTTASSTRGEQVFGVLTTGRDIVGRHEVGAQLAVDPSTREMSGDLAWRYAGFGVPLFDAAASQSWDAFEIRDSARVRVGEIARRNRVVSLTTTWQRPRVRTGAFLAGGVELEWRDFATDPAPLLAQLDPLLSRTLRYPGAVLAVGWNNVRRAPLAISTEDGIAASVTLRERWRSDDRAATAATSALADLRLYKSLPLPGHARHVIALRAVGGLGDRTMARPFSVGGVSGTSLELFPGFRIGDVQRAFSVRGFAPGTQQGVQAWALGGEYRAPLPLVGRGIFPFPLYWQRSALTFFTDAASAWCPAGAESAGCPAGGTPRQVLASVGGELAVDMAVDYDRPTRFRVGAALPVRGAEQRLRGYVSIGVQF